MPVSRRKFINKYSYSVVNFANENIFLGIFIYSYVRLSEMREQVFLEFFSKCQSAKNGIFMLLFKR